jgi:hypothetical protein
MWPLSWRILFTVCHPWFRRVMTTWISMSKGCFLTFNLACIITLKFLSAFVQYPCKIHSLFSLLFFPAFLFVPYLSVRFLFFLQSLRPNSWRI